VSDIFVIHCPGREKDLEHTIWQPYGGIIISWWRGTVVERRSLTGKLSLSCARPAADG